MAEAALNLLLANLKARRADAGSAITEQVLEHELVIRESSAPPLGKKRKSARPAAEKRARPG